MYTKMNKPSTTDRYIDDSKKVEKKPQALTTNDAVSTLPTGPHVTGDWVLFHPVYSPEELRAIEVSPFFYLHCIGHI